MSEGIKRAVKGKKAVMARAGMTIGFGGFMAIKQVIDRILFVHVMVFSLGVKWSSKE